MVSKSLFKTHSQISSVVTNTWIKNPVAHVEGFGAEGRGVGARRGGGGGDVTGEIRRLNIQAGLSQFTFLAQVSVFLIMIIYLKVGEKIKCCSVF